MRAIESARRERIRIRPPDRRRDDSPYAEVLDCGRQDALRGKGSIGRSKGLTSPKIILLTATDRRPDWAVMDQASGDRIP